MQSIVHIIKVSDSFFKNFSYIIANSRTNDAIVIDPAWQLSKIEEVIRTHQLHLRAICLTHSHFDHVNLVPPLVAKYDVQVYMSQQEIDFYGYTSPNLCGFSKDEILPLDAFSIRPLVTPGHTKGSSCYLIDNQLFSGDTLFTEGCGICMGEGADPHEMFFSLQMLKSRLTSSTKIFPGHSFGSPVGMTMKYLRKNNLYLHFDDVEKFTRYRMRKSQKSIFNFT